MHKSALVWITIICLLIGCTADEEVEPSTEKEQTFFELKKPNDTGVHFVNQVKDRQDFNILTYRNFYNGGGVAIGDINNDSLPDLYFTSNLGPNKLYLNTGDFQFEDITDQAGVSGQRGWSTGVTMADVNADGFLDIYVSNSGDMSGDNKENELFINDGNLGFTEQAADYGLHNNGYSTQAAFFDYDQDGDLDCYLLNNSFKDPAKIELYKSMRDIPDELSGDRLYRNEDGKFIDVSARAGIFSSAIGFGLGACVGDVNQDNLPDIYVSNDFWERDYLYINQGDGTFSEELSERMDFCSISSMGGDIADINNDGFPEIVSTDMLAADNYRLKAMSRFDPYHLEDMKYRANYHYQIAQNCLHLNDGQGRFQEIAMMANVGATDWSWGALMFDFENDGFKDLFVSNGLQKDLMYMDFRDYLTNENVHQKMAKKEEVDLISVISNMPSSPLVNYGFSNQKGTEFENATQQLGLDQKSFSNGAAYGDLDNDGDLDLVVNNVNMYAFIYENKAEETQNNYLKLKFQGPSKNPFGIGATAMLKTKKGKQFLENFNTRGFQSSIEAKLIFGIAADDVIEELVITWPDNRRQVLRNIKENETLEIQYDQADGVNQPVVASTSQLDNNKINDFVIGNTRHQENEYNDFDHELLLTSMLSTEGPHIITGDVNNDKRDDFILLGAHDDPDKLFIQQDNGQFLLSTQAAFNQDKGFESINGELLDIDRDKDLDLVIGSGGNESQRGSKVFTLRAYLNDGNGSFTAGHSVMPPLYSNVSCIKKADVDGDGDMDLFVGSRLIPGNYGWTPIQVLLLNDNGTWIKDTPPGLAGIGMVTDATWVDINNDRFDDLIVVGDWMDIHVFTNFEGELKKSTTIDNSKGWWNCIEKADLDNDGDMDFVLGNRGTNSKFSPGPDKAMTMYVNDFDQNGKTEFVINWTPPLDSISYPFATKPELTAQIPQLRKKILKYEDYAKQDYQSLFTGPVRQKSWKYKVTNLHSSVLWNEGGDSWTLEELPLAAQISPVYATTCYDFTGDGITDIWLGGNFYALKPQVGRHNASRGVLLKGNNDKTFTELSHSQSRIYVTGEVRDASVLRSSDKDVLLVARNNDTAMMFPLGSK